MTLIDILEYNVKVRPQEKAISMKIGYRNKMLTYLQVYDLSMKIACFLKEEGLKEKDNVILISPNSPYWVCIFWAVLMAGGIIVPLNTQSKKDFINKVINQTNSKFIFKNLKNKEVERNESLKIYDIEVIIQNIEKVKYARLKKTNIKESSIMEILYTSGTTGDPKGVILTHDNLLSNVRAISGLITITSKDKVLSILPLSHIFEQVVGFLVPFRNGAEIIYTHSPAAIGNLLQEHHITKMITVPEFLKLFIIKIKNSIKEKKIEKFFNWQMKILKNSKSKLLQRLAFFYVHAQLGGKLKIISSGGAALDINLEKEWETLGFKILQGYGLTETSPVVSMNTLENDKLGTVGKVIPWTKVKIAKDGEILVKGPNVFQGYYKNQKLTQKVFTDDGWFKTGDVGEFDKDGFLYIKGRKKYMILGAGGQNVYPEDLENVINKIEGVIDSCVLGIEGANNRLEIHAVILAENESINLEKIIDEANTYLSTYQQISKAIRWEETDFPRTSTRKIKRDEIIKFLKERKSKTVKKSILEKTPLIEILADVTGFDTDEIQKETKVVKDLNLDSLLRIELVSRIEEKLNVTINEADISYQTTVEKLEDLVSKAKPLEPKIKIYKWQIHPVVKFLRWLAQWVLIFPFTMFFVNLKIEGTEIFKEVEKPFILMPNHAGNLDSLVLLAALPFGIRKDLSFSAAADVWYKNKGRHIKSMLGEFVFNIFPFYRRKEENIKEGIDDVGLMIDRGCCVAVYPEGRVSATGNLEPLKKGTGLIAVEMNCPIIPVKTFGLPEIWDMKKLLPNKRGMALIRFGKPMRFTKETTYDEATEEIEKVMKGM